MATTVRSACLFIGVSLLAAGAVQAIGGDDFNPADQINKATEKCQKEIATAGGKLAFKRVRDISGCLDKILKCDEQPDSIKATACRRKLVVPTSGSCAVGKLDDGISTIGLGAAGAAVADAGSKTRLTRELQKLVASLEKRCFEAGVDLSDPTQGLGFTPSPLDAAELADLVNDTDDGVGCRANEMIRATHPLLDEILEQVVELHDTCAVADNPADLGMACATDVDCGAAKGSCAQVALVLREGEGETLMRCGETKTVFVTSTRFNGPLGSVSGADAQCQARADAAGLGGTFKAWIAAGSQSPSASFSRSTIPYALVDGTRIADNWTDLTDGAIQNPIDLDENEGNAGGLFVWTAVASNGSFNGTFGTCSNWTSPVGTGGVGFSSFTDSRWSLDNSFGCSGSPAPLYCFEQ